MITYPTAPTQEINYPPARLADGRRGRSWNRRRARAGPRFQDRLLCAELGREWGFWCHYVSKICRGSGGREQVEAGPGWEGRAVVRCRVGDHRVVRGESRECVRD